MHQIPRLPTDALDRPVASKRIDSAGTGSSSADPGTAALASGISRDCLGPNSYSNASHPSLLAFYGDSPRPGKQFNTCHPPIVEITHHNHSIRATTGTVPKIPSITMGTVPMVIQLQMTNIRKTKQANGLCCSINRTNSCHKVPATLC